MTTNYIYLVFSIPRNVPTNLSFFTCNRDPSSSPPANGNCNFNEYCYDIDTANYPFTCNCAGATDTVMATYGCSGTLTSVYDYLGGNPSISSPYSIIPGIGNNPSTGKPYYPMDLTNPTGTLMGDYAGIIYPGANYITTTNGGNTSTAAPPGYLVVAYDPTWFTSWADLDKIAPPGNPFNGTNNLILNTVTNSLNPFTLQTSNAPVAQGSEIPSIEAQFTSLLYNFCFLTSSSCPPGVNNGSCSYTISSRTDGLNYCSIVMAANGAAAGSGNPLPYPTFDSSMANYCNSEAGLTECYCVDPQAVPNNAFSDFVGLGLAGISSSANIGCWWEPCLQKTTHLIPSTQWNPTNCSSVCSEISGLIASGQGNTIINNPSLQNNLSCCSPNGQVNCSSGPAPPPPPSGNCTSNTDCPSGQQCRNNNCSIPSTVPCSDTNPCPSGQHCSNGTCYSNPPPGCSSNSDCNSGQSCVGGTCTVESFWDKYKVYILVALFIVIFILILLVVLWIIK